MKPNLKFWRRLLQLSVALAFILIPYLNRHGLKTLSGNFLAFNAAGLPLADPLAAAQVGIKSGALPAEVLIGAAIPLILALILGTVFCAWVCPFGLLSEWLHHLSRKVFPRAPGRLSRPDRGFHIRLALFGLGCVVFLFFSDGPFFNQLSLPGWYSRIFQIYFNQAQISWAAGFLVAVLLVEFVAQKRLWCRYLCPQSLLLAAVRLVNPWHLKVSYAKDKCICGKGEDPCRRVCHLGLNPRTLSHSHDLECTNCGDCIVTCKKLGQALTFRFHR